MRRLPLLLFVLVAPFAANADPIVNVGTCVVETITCFLDIENLEIDGHRYNVSWEPAPLVDLLDKGSGAGSFINDSSLANLAAQAIYEAFLSTDIVANTYGGDGLFIAAVYVTYTVDGSRAWLASSNRTGVRLISVDDTSRLPWAVFTPVPEPGTLALFGIGLFGMGCARHRKKA